MKRQYCNLQIRPQLNINKKDSLIWLAVHINYIRLCLSVVFQSLKLRDSGLYHCKYKFKCWELDPSVSQGGIGAHVYKAYDSSDFFHSLSCLISSSRQSFSDHLHRYWKIFQFLSWKSPVKLVMSLSTRTPSFIFTQKGMRSHALSSKRSFFTYQQL